MPVHALHWKHVFNLPLLPPGFQVFLQYTVSYIVTVRDIQSGETVGTLFSSATRLNVSPQVLDDCRRRNVTVQALVNDTLSDQSSPYNTTPTCEWISATRNDALTLGAHAAARVTVVAVCVCVSVRYSTSHFTSHESLHKQYIPRIQRRV